MIYSIYWSALQQANYVPSYFYERSYQVHPSYSWSKDLPQSHKSNQCFNGRELLATMIKESTDDSFVFVIVNNQMEGFNKWLDDNQLNSLIVADSGKGVTNGNHTNNPRNMHLFVLCSKDHPNRDMFIIDEEMELV